MQTITWRVNEPESKRYKTEANADSQYLVPGRPVTDIMKIFLCRSIIICVVLFVVTVYCDNCIKYYLSIRVFRREHDSAMLVSCETIDCNSPFR